MATYKDSGVDIEKAEKVLKQLKKNIETTHNSNVLKGIGSFGAMYDFSKMNVKEPVLVSSSDGVGTKLMVAFMMDKHDTVGEDLVNHCVNDIAVTGAKPMFFLDYFATGKLNPIAYAGGIEGLTRGCKNHNMPLIGGETAEMPDMYSDEEYDLAGNITGVVEKSKMITGEKICAGDIVIGLPSTGLHTNGYSLARKVLFEKFKVDQHIDELQGSIGEELLKVHRSYFSIIEKVSEKFEINGLSHITGGGLYKNTIRLFGDDLDFKVDWNSWEWLPIFNVIQEAGKISDEEMRLAFNLGIGLGIIVNSSDESALLQTLMELNMPGKVIGSIEKKGK